MSTHLQQLFSHAYILGGSPCSGKSTVAELLAAEYGFHYYRVDDYESQHMQRAHADKQPVMYQFTSMSWEQIWSPPPEEQCALEIAYYHERFPFILDDLQQLDPEKPVLLEGAAFLPELIHAYPVRRENAVFLVPSLEFQLQHYSQRPWIHSILNQCREPERAFEHWMQRDHLFGLEVVRQATAYGFPALVVDGSQSAREHFEIIRTQFGLK